VSAEAFQRAAEERGLRGKVHFRLLQCEDVRLSSAVQGLAAAIQAEASPLEQQTWLVRCIQGMQGYVERQPGEPTAQVYGAAVRQAMDCLRERYRESVDLAELSALTGLSRFALVHAFSNQVGISPHAYQTRVRVERARRLLERGFAPAMVAAEVGFADQSHLHRHFKNVLQVTPGEYTRSAGPIVTFPYHPHADHGIPLELP
jgi:AraC-like DNA-binding protein